MAPKPTISRTGVYGIAIQNEEFLFVKQRKGPHAGKWDLPGGGIEPGETIERALRRELLEEAGMEFTAMTLFNNLTAISEGTDEKGNPYIFHQIGLVYHIHGISQSPQQIAEMEHAWIHPEKIEEERISPFVRQLLLYSGVKAEKACLFDLEEGSPEWIGM